MKRPQQRPRNDQRRRRDEKPGPVDIWRSGEPLPEFRPIVMSSDTVAMIRSLGEPPMHSGTEAGVHIGSVIERAAGIAVALAFSADLLGTRGD